MHFPPEAVLLGVGVGLVMSKLLSMFVQQCLFGGVGTLRGREDSSLLHARLVRTSMGRVRVLVREQPARDREWVVLVHGFAGALDVFADPDRANYANELFAMGFHVLCVDLYGHGGSDSPDTRYGAELYASQLAELVLLLDIPTCTLLAHSMGCAAAVTFASMHKQRVTSLVLLSPSVSHKRFPWYLRLALRVPGFREVLSACIIPTFGEGTNRGNVGFVRSCYRLLETRLATRGSWNFGEWKTLKLCAGLRQVPTLVLWGDADEVESFQIARDQLLHVLPQALLCACNGGDHMSFADGTPPRKLFYLDRIKSFLRRDLGAMDRQGVLTLQAYYRIHHDYMDVEEEDVEEGDGTEPLL